jgi:NADH:ubiquinone reductase (H+-translocating)
VVGKGFAVMESGKIRISGLPAFVVWGAVHLLFLARLSLQVNVFVQWVWSYLTDQRDSMLIVDHRGTEAAKTAPQALSRQASQELQHQA